MNARSNDNGHQPMLRLLALLPPPTRTQMVAMYRQALGSQLEEIARALSGTPDESTTKLVHKLAGSAAMMQDGALSVPAREVERALIAGDTATAAALWPEVQEAGQRTLAALPA